MERSFGLDSPIEAIHSGCVRVINASPLRKGEQIEVLELADPDACASQILVMVRLMDRTFAVPLAQLRPIDVSAETRQAIEDWHYWVAPWI
jgi:hypothetical protein